ncbi:MAG: amidophosphoribosyltransferase, partial [Rhodospirillales bacterium]|nr:amidophosphoribosyltransferase [Rhodospirillales bacterium]
MCGIAGILFKGDHRNLTTGQALINMLDGCQHRGPDSTGFALYREANEDELRLRFLVGSGAEAEQSVESIKGKLVEYGADIIGEEAIGPTYCFVVRF